MSMVGVQLNCLLLYPCAACNVYVEFIGGNSILWFYGFFSTFDRQSKVNSKLKHCHCSAVWFLASESLGERSHYSSHGVFKSSHTIASYRRFVTLSLTWCYYHSTMQHKQSFWHFWKILGSSVIILQRPLSLPVCNGGSLTSFWHRLDRNLIQGHTSRTSTLLP